MPTKSKIESIITLKKNKRERNEFEDEDENGSDFLIINTYRYNNFIKLVEFKIKERSKLERLKQLDDFFKEKNLGITVDFITNRNIIEKMIPFFKNNYKHVIIDVFSQDIYEESILKIFKSEFKTIIAKSLDLIARYKCFLHETIFLLNNISIGRQEKFESIRKCRKVIVKYDDFFHLLEKNIQSDKLKETYYSYKRCCLNVLNLNKYLIQSKLNNDKVINEEEKKFINDVLIEVKDLLG